MDRRTWLDASVILQIFPHDAFPSITLKANALTPSWALYEGVHCNGISIDIHKPLVNAVSLGFRLLQCIAEHHHEKIDDQTLSHFGESNRK